MTSDSTRTPGPKNEDQHPSPPPAAGPWQVLATGLADELDEPVALIDSTGHFVLVNRATERLLGRRRDELLGASCFGGHVPPERQASARLHLRDGLSVSIRRDGELIGAKGRRYKVTVELSALQSGDARFVFVRARSAQLIAAPGDPLRSSAMYYDVSIGPRPADRYQLKVVAYLGEPLLDREVEGHLCHRFLFGRDTPCEGCLMPEAIATQKKQVAVSVPEDPAQPFFSLVTAQLLSKQLLRVKQRLLPATTLDALVRARIRVLARGGGLSARQESVLVLLCGGRSLEDIARELRISVRTVKFHQANLLQKLGVDSRLDLLRLFF